ncbi:MAG: MucBP domain-containing protein [Paenibacillus dendritiformis]|uniref:MucBP domain-containing protein n=1 Tax=uncultured Paenibacillus sp. TaxID=227322 RepID=UPI0025E0AB0B|nr:MucBP domain-containing protein [uncultured Paenibacillus sp.]MDU5142604.1 MucBP domain-containing protein [Paenibacillus dendritiformis]
MKRRFRLVVTWLCMFSVAFGTIPGTLGAQAASSGELEWPNPGAVKLTKEANPVEGKLDEWDITLTVEGKNLKSGSSDVVLVIDKSGSMTQKPNQNRLPKAKDAAKKFVDNLLIEDSDTRIAVVTFNKTSDQVSDFKGLDQKTELKRAIDNIQATGGTNIQAGLHEAQELLKTSQANNKVIVLLSDGEPTYSYKASTAVKGSWGNNSHQFILSDFNDKNIIGSGSSYSLGSNWYGLGKETCFLWSCSYEFEIKDNGIGTISEAKLAHDAGIHIYSIGLDVGSNSNATNTLKDVANKGYYSGTSDSLERIFSELASKIAFAAENAVVTDPMGDMFDLKLKGSSFGPDDYKASQGEVTWNPQTETFTWNIGNVTEGNPATLTYRVKMDHSKNPDPKQLYPTNKTTTMNYTDAKGDRTSKDFEVPRVGLGKGSILVKAYKVNANGKPVNSDGQEVERPDLAQELYSRYHEEDGSDALEVGKSYTVPAPTVPGYTLRVGDNPTKVDLTVSKPSPIIWFGYNDVPNKLTIVHQSGDKVLDRSEADKKPGESIDVSSKNFDGYEFSNVEVSKGSGLTVDSGHVTGVMPGQDVTITFHYTAKDQSVKVRYVDRATGKDLLEPSVKTGKTGETLTLEAAHVGGYEAEKPTTVEYVMKAGENPDHIFYYNGTEQSVKVRYVDRGTGKELLAPIVKTGKTGEELTLKAEEIAGYEAEEPTTVEYVLKAENPDHVFYYNGLGQGVKVRYVDRATGKDLLEPSVKTGKTGEELTLKAEEIAGYEAEEPKTVTYELKAGENPDHIFYYTAEKQTVTVKYLEKGTDKVLAEATAHEGATGQTVTLEAKPIPGYTAENDTYAYTFKAGTNEYIFYYAGSSQTLTVKYLEQGTEKELAAEKLLEGVTGQTIGLTAEEVAGYKPLNATHKYTFSAEADQVYTFYYTKDDPTGEERTVIVHYVDRATEHSLKESTSHIGQVGSALTLKAEDITVTDSVYKPERYSVEYTVTADTEQEYTFYYNKVNEGETYTVTVHYVDQESNLALQAPSTHSGKAGEVLWLRADQITVTDAVYTPLKFNELYTITTASDQQYTFYYVKGEHGDIQLLTVNHLEAETNHVLKESERVKGRAGEQILYRTSPITVTGAVYHPEHPSYSYTFTAEPEQMLNIFYKKDPSQTEHKVTVKYLEQGTGNTLAAPTTKSGKPGEQVTLTAVPVSGYTPVKSSDTYTFTDAEGQEYIFYYTKNSSNPDPDGGSPGGSTTTITPSPKPLPPVPPVPPLPPVPPKLDMENHYNYINGYPDGTVKPENQISREEVAAIFYRLMENESRANYLTDQNSFSDVAKKRWSNKHISTMERAGIITGYQDGTFKPGQSITRAEFAAIASRFDKLNDQANGMFSDISGHWAEKYIVSAANKGWIKGYPDGTFKPNQYITRAEAMAFINSVLNRKVKAADIHDDAKQWPDNKPGKWYYTDVLEATNHHEYSRSENGYETWDSIQPDRVYP